MHWKTREEGHHVKGKERVPNFLAMRGDDAVVASEVTRGYAIQLQLELHAENQCLLLLYINIADLPRQ